MASIYLSCLVFCDFNFIWLLLAFFPFIVLVSLEGLKINKDQAPVSQYFDSVNNTSQRRKLTNRAVAIYIILFLLPLGALVLFGYLNATHAGTSTYFLYSQYANWHVLGNQPIGEVIDNNHSFDKSNVAFQSQVLFQFYVLLLNPLLFLVFFYFKGKMYELFTLIAPFILVGILLINTQSYFMIEYYLIFLVLGLVGLTFYAGKQFTKKATWFIFFVVGLLNVFAGIYYFKRTNDENEWTFFNAIRDYKNWLKVKNTSEDYLVAQYISSIADINNKVLMDDAAAFQIVAHLKSLEGIELPINKSFGTVIENPVAGVRFMCVAKFENRLKNYTVLNSYNLSLMEAKGQFVTEMVYQTNNWAVYRIYPVEEQ
jgi:cytochrome b561